MLKNWISWDKKSLVYFFIRVPALVFQPIVTAYIPKAIIDAVTDGVTTQRLILIVGLLSLLLTFTIWMDPFMRELIRGGARIVRMRYAVMAFEKNLKTDYVNIEDLEKREMQKRAEKFYSGRWSGGESFIDRCNQFCVAVVGVIASGILILKINSFIVLLIIVSCAAEFFILKDLFLKEDETYGKASKYLNRFNYFYRLCKDGSAAKDIKLYSLSDYFIKALASALYETEKIYSKLSHQDAAADFLRALLNCVREAIAYFYLVYLVTKGQIGVSDFVFYFGVVTGFSNWVRGLILSVINIGKSCKECEAFIAYINSGDTAEKGKKLCSKEVNSIEFKNVSYKYPSAENETIKNINLKFSYGEKIAVVGENGAGKTTLIKLLCGLYGATSGKILLNGEDISGFSKESYFDLFAPIFQDYYFLPMTVAQNICATAEYDAEKLNLAFENAGIAEKINSLPERENSLMDSRVYNNAVDFSGGEKQKLLLAKAVYKDAPVLILDEPTAALDPIAENELYLKYNELTHGKLSFFISHRLSSTRFCDRILFMSNGRITEEGTHEELMAAKGAYYRMYNTQSYYYKEQGVAVNE